MDRYEIVDEVARGASGVVYRARDRELDRTVALKLMRREAAGDQARERFLREARLAARLDHPGIIPIYGFGLDESRPYFTMPFVTGRPLRDLLEEGRPEPREAARIAFRVACALEYAHRRDVVHRDLKPSNILMTEKGDVVLVDFGIARDLGTGDRLTEKGELLGTPLYMSPEQMSGGEVGPPADLFAFGCILYEMLCGDPPFEADSFIELSSRVLNKDPVRPSERAEQVPEVLEDVCLKCLRRDPAKRPAAGDVAQALDRYLHPPRRRSVSWMPFVPVAAALAVLFLAAVGSPGARRPDAKLYLSTDPSGATIEGAERIGITPLETDLPEGRHLLRIRAGGHAEAFLAVVAEAGADIRYHVVLPPRDAAPPGMVYVAGGVVVLPSPVRGDRRIRFEPLFVDRTEVTCEEYSRFIEETGRDAPLGWRVGRPVRGTESWPVSGVTAEDADAYAKRCGKRLPTEEEWEFLARGVDGRFFPWGDSLPAGWSRRIDAWEHERGPAPVGSAGYDVSPFGVLDLAGGVREWTATPGAFDPDSRVVRGGAWSLPLVFRDITRCDQFPTKTKNRLIGFRCVMDFEQKDGR
ncbi:MAG: protein kinase domain-containing protein [Planctomycetota bacterium]|jgi:serine/threonine-protein kinase